MGFLPKPHHLHLVIRKMDKSRLGDSLKDNWTVLLNTVKVKKNGKTQKLLQTTGDWEDTKLNAMWQSGLNPRTKKKNTNGKIDAIPQSLEFT